jgi:hypothetical protein
MAKKAIFRGLFVLALGLAITGCEYNYFEAGGTLTVVNKTREDYYVGTSYYTDDLLKPGSSKSWDFDDNTSVTIYYCPTSRSYPGDRKIDIEYGVETVVNLVY